MAVDPLSRTVSLIVSYLWSYRCVFLRSSVRYLSNHTHSSGTVELWRTSKASWRSPFFGGTWLCSVSPFQKSPTTVSLCYAACYLEERQHPTVLIFQQLFHFIFLSMETFFFLNYTSGSFFFSFFKFYLLLPLYTRITAIVSAPLQLDRSCCTRS